MKAFFTLNIVIAVGCSLMVLSEIIHAYAFLGSALLKLMAAL